MIVDVILIYCVYIHTYAEKIYNYCGLYVGKEGYIIHI